MLSSYAEHFFIINQISGVISSKFEDCVFFLFFTARDEITNSIKTITEGVFSGDLNVSDIDEQLVSNCMYTNKSPDPDLLVRTSGEIRFSDFLLWQISCTQVCFTDVLWPELSIWHLLTAVFKYQTRYNEMISVKEAKTSLANNSRYCRNESRVANFLNHVDEYRRNQIESYLNI